MRRLMIAAMSSGSGKTVLSCGLLAALKARGISAEAFKCGPDYIDPMFHSRVLGVPEPQPGPVFAGGSRCSAHPCPTAGPVRAAGRCHGFL